MLSSVKFTFFSVVMDRDLRDSIIHDIDELVSKNFCVLFFRGEGGGVDSQGQGYCFIEQV